MGRRVGLSRRTVLRGLGAAVALPWLEAMLPAAGRIASAEDGSAGPPIRLAFWFTPNGAHMPDWTPKTPGTDAELPDELPRILEPLAPHRDRLLVLSGLAQDQAHAHGDGPGDHARSAAVFLTGAHPVKTAGKDIRVGVSADQRAAAQLGRTTRFPSLELGCEPSALAGNCDSGYSCAYSSNIAWRTPTMPLSKEVDPRAVFERLFGAGRPGETARQRELRRRFRRSVVDLVGDDAERLTKRLGRADREKVDEYLAGIREIERRIERAEADLAKVRDGGADVEVPDGIPADFGEHVGLMAELMTVAFQLDQTRVVTFMLANAGSNRIYREIGVRERHHGISHHGGDEQKVTSIRRINRYHVELLAKALDRMAQVEEGDGTLLDHTLLVYGSGIGDGNRHNHDDLPILLAGGAAAGVRSGRHVRVPKNTPLNNLFLSMLERAGCDASPFGDATRTLGRLG